MLILEGRKENVFNKYESQIRAGRKLVSNYLDNGSAYDFLITDPFMIQSNYKYLDELMRIYLIMNEFYLSSENQSLPTRDAFNFIMKEREYLTRAINALEFFESNKKKFKYNQFSDYIKNETLDDFLKEYKKLKSEREKKKELEIKKTQVTRIYEDENVLVLRPLTYEASCIYGASTKWCTASKQSMEHFLNYSSTGGLYYIIFKKIPSDNIYHKVAIYKTETGQTWWDSVDKKMSGTEIGQMISVLPEDIMPLIKQDFETEYPVDPIVVEAFNSQYTFTAQREMTNQDVIGKWEFGVTFYAPKVESETETSVKCEVFIEKELQEVTVGTYLMKNEIEYRTNFVNFYATPQVISEDMGIPLKGPIDFNVQLGHKIPRNFFNDYGMKLFTRIYEQLVRNEKFIDAITPKDVIISKSPKTDAGYTFEKRSGVIGELLKWLDSGKVGTKTDFLVDIGKLDYREGKFYTKGSNSPIVARGYLAPLFSTAKAVGIIDYKKDGQRFLMTKGPNFEKYKSGAKIVFL
jgi:hypothetical protein